MVADAEGFEEVGEIAAPFDEGFAGVWLEVDAELGVGHVVEDVELGADHGGDDGFALGGVTLGGGEWGAVRAVVDAEPAWVGVDPAGLIQGVEFGGDVAGAAVAKEEEDHACGYAEGLAETYEDA